MQAITRWFQKQSSWIESQQASILSAATIILVANITSGISGLIKNRVFSSLYITNEYGNAIDAYWVAFRAPEFAYQLIVFGSLSAAFVPLFAHWYKKDVQRAFTLASQTFYLILGIFSIATLTVLIGADTFISLLTGPNFTPEQHTLAVNMTRIMMGAQCLFALSGFASALLQGTKRFIVPAFSPVFYNLGIILGTVLLSPWLGLYAAAWGTVLGAALHLLVQIPLLAKVGFRWFHWPEWSKDDLKLFFKLTAPRTLAIALTQANMFVTTFFATTLGGLSLTLITFSQQLMIFPIRFFGVSIAQAALPFLAAEQDDLTGFRRTVFRSLRQIVFFTAPAAVLLIVLRVPLVRLAYGTDEFTWRSTLITAESLGILSLSIVPQAATHLLVRAFYALNDTVLPLLASLLYVVVTFVLSWYTIMVLNGTITGLSWSLTGAAYAEALLLLFVLLYRIHPREMLSIIMPLARIIFASFLMAITLFVFQRVLDLYVFETSKTLQLLQLTTIVTALGGSVYLLFCWIFRVEELMILEKIRVRFRGQMQKILRGTPPSIVDSVRPE